MKIRCWKYESVEVANDFVFRSAKFTALSRFMTVSTLCIRVLPSLGRVDFRASSAPGSENLRAPAQPVSRRVRKNSRQSQGWEGIFGLSFSQQIAYYLGGKAEKSGLLLATAENGDVGSQVWLVDKFSTEI